MEQLVQRTVLEAAPMITEQVLRQQGQQLQAAGLYLPTNQGALAAANGVLRELAGSRDEDRGESPLLFFLLG
jgi:hypothetical protein